MKYKWFNKRLLDKNPDWFGEWKVWRNEPNDNHAWAFIYYLARRGDVVLIKGNKERLHIGVKKQL